MKKIKNKYRNDRLLGIWNSMKTRCYSSNSINYKYYGGKGIKICNNWLIFDNFYIWSMNNGYKDKLSIDRIDSNGDYCPENCRWVTRSENSKMSTSKLITFEGLTMNLTDWEKHFGFKRDFIAYRLRSGWAFEKAINTVNIRSSYIRNMSQQDMELVKQYHIQGKSDKEIAKLFNIPQPKVKRILNFKPK